MSTSVAIVFALSLPAPTSVPGIADTDWPQWRGPTRDCRVADGTQWPSTLDGLKQSWRVPLGPSYSGPIVLGNRVFVTETRDKKEEVVRALDRTTGEELWTARWQGAMEVPFFARANGSWIRSTPATDGQRLFVSGIRDVLVCLDVETGKEIWRLDFMKQFESPLPGFGAVCSPLIHGGHVYIQAGAAIVKLKSETGAVVWRTAPAVGGAFGASMESSAFSSPVIATIAGREQLVVQTRKSLQGIALDDGSRLWSVDVPAFRGMNIQTPLVSGDSVFTSSYGGGTFVFDVAASGDKMNVTQRWKTNTQGYMSSPVLIGKDVYLHLRNQRFTCLKFETGDSNWTTRPFGKYWSMAVNGDRILALDQRGSLLLIDANNEAWNKVGERKLTDEETWAHLAVSGNQVLVRELNAMSVYTWK